MRAIIHQESRAAAAAPASPAPSMPRSAPLRDPALSPDAPRPAAGATGLWPRLGAAPAVPASPPPAPAAAPSLRDIREQQRAASDAHRAAEEAALSLHRRGTGVVRRSVSESTQWGLVQRRAPVLLADVAARQREEEDAEMRMLHDALRRVEEDEAAAAAAAAAATAASAAGAAARGRGGRGRGRGRGRRG
jgi:hypothetical protein